MGRKNSRSEIREIDQSTWEELQLRTLFGIKSILTLVTPILKILPTINAQYYTTAITAGLYTYAVEEYGKLLILQSYTPSNGRVRINEHGELEDHDIKFKKASEVLPEECLCINPAVDIITNFGIRKSIFFSEIDKNGKLVDVPWIDIKTLENAIFKFQEIVNRTIIKLRSM